MNILKLLLVLFYFRAHKIYLSCLHVLCLCPLSPNEQKQEVQNKMKMSRKKIFSWRTAPNHIANCKNSFYFVFFCHPFLCLMKFNYSTLCTYKKTLNVKDGTTNGILLYKVNMHGGNYSFAIVATLEFILSCLCCCMFLCCWWF
jgi:hypothetical protein